MAPELNERQRRLWAASEARAAGRGGITATARATGMAIDTIRRGIAELESGERITPGRVRRPGGGRRSLLERDPTILDDIERLVDEDSRGDPESLLRWTAKSVRQIAGALREMGHQVHFTSVAAFMRLLGYSLQANVKTKEGASHPDRDAQFGHINQTAKAAVAAGWPVISVDTKKKELVGDFKNPGRCWRRQDRDVLDHDFPSWAVGRAIPYGIYDLAFNDGLIVVGTSHETPSFAVAAIRRWWLEIGRWRYAGKRRLLIEADAGGANDARKWEWKEALPGLADQFGLIITVTHYPPGASKWNPIDHRMFSLVSANWSGEPLVNYETILGYIRRTRSPEGFHGRARLDTTDYPVGYKVTPKAKGRVRLNPRPVLPKWNYTIRPHDKPKEC